MPDFKGNNDNVAESWYDLNEDWMLIEASLAKQYGIRIRNEKEMKWDEFCTLISGLMPDTPLGHLVSIRSEKDSSVIKSFSVDQRRIHNEWRTRKAKKMLDNPEKLEKELNDIINMFAIMFTKS